MTKTKKYGTCWKNIEERARTGLVPIFLVFSAFDKTLSGLTMICAED